MLIILVMRGLDLGKWTVERQRQERSDLSYKQGQRWERETAERAQRLSKGLRSIWDRLTGKHQKVRTQNEREALLAFYRDRGERDGLIFKHIGERQPLQDRIRGENAKHSREAEQLRQDIAHFMDRCNSLSPAIRDHFDEATAQRANPKSSGSRDKDRGPKLER